MNASSGFRVALVVALAAAFGCLPPASLAGPLGALHAGLELGRAFPIAPRDFGSGWGDATGCGAFVTLDLSGPCALVLRLDRDRFPFDPHRMLAPPTGAVAARGGEATIDNVALGLRVRGKHGALRAHATAYVGRAWREGRRMDVGYRYGGSTFDVTYGEPDGASASRGFDVGVIWALPRLPDLIAEGRVTWFGDGEMYVPLRAGLVLP